MSWISKFISWLFLPLLAPLYALIVLLYLPTIGEDAYTSNNLSVLEFSYKKPFFLIFLVFSFLAPAFTILMLYFRGSIKMLMMHEKEERIVPAIMTNLYGVALCILLYLKVPMDYLGFAPIMGLAVGSSFTVLCCTLITIKWKISLHAAGMGILNGFCFTLFLKVEYTSAIFVLSMLMVLSGIVMSARFHLKAHSMAQLYCGFGLGFLSLVSTMFILYSIVSH